MQGTVDFEHDTGRPPRIGFVPQDARDSFLAHDPLTELQLRLQAHGWKYRGARDEAMRLLDECDLRARARVPIHRLSAGERRRLALFASRVHRPSLVLLDEPLNHLDDAWRSTLINDVSALAEKALVIVATHEPEPWLPAATQQVRVENGEARTSQRASTARVEAWNRGPLLRAGPELVVSQLADARKLFAGAGLRLGTGLHAVAGPNGSGKSTLLRILGGLETPAAGRVVFDGRDVHQLPPSTLARFRAHHIEEPRETFFLDTGAQEIRFQPRNAGFSDAESDERGVAAADAFGLGTIVDRHPLSLSGGEQERVALACTHATRANLVLLDEPTHGLDERGRASLLGFLADVSNRACVVLATHDERLLAMSDTVHRFESGRLVPVRGPDAKPLVEVRPRAP